MSENPNQDESAVPPAAALGGTSAEAESRREPSARPGRARRFAGKAGPATWALWVGFGLFFAFVIWQGISQLFFPGVSLAAVRQVNVLVYLLVGIGGILVPLAFAALAIWVGRARTLGIRALLLLAALAAAPAVVTTLLWLGTLVVAS